MSAPTRFPAGVSTFPTQHVQGTFPTLPSQYQVVKGDDFIPFRQSTDYTATASGTGSTAVAQSWNGGAVKLTAGSTSTFKSFEALGANSLQIIPGNQGWFDIRLAAPGAGQTNPSTDSAIYAGWFDNVDPTAATNGLYFRKNAATSSVSFFILKNSVLTEFSNVADMGKPSGFYGDGSSSAGTITANATGTTLTSLSVTAPGSGYRIAPLVVVNGTAGSGAQAYVQLGGTTYVALNPSNSALVSSGGGALYAPYVTAAGSSYTAGTLTVDTIPWINLQFWYDGKGVLRVGVNGKIVLSIGAGGVTTIAPGSSNAVPTSNSYNFVGTYIGGSQAAQALAAPVQPSPGDFYVAAPQVPMQVAFGIVGTTGNNRVCYVEEVNTATELN